MSKRKARRGCRTAAHGVHRRQFLQVGGATALGVGLGALDGSANLACAEELKRQQKHVIMIWLAGGSSQFETWDPKPGRPTGGPFNAIPTAVPGTHISELMPKVAAMTDRLAIVRSLDTTITAHGPARDTILRGRQNDPGLVYPDMGSVIAKELAQRDAEVPDYVSIYTASEGRTKPNPGYLGSRFAAMNLHESLQPETLKRPEGISEAEHTQREHLRQFLTERFNASRRAEKLTGYNSTYARVKGLMRSDSLFDVEQESRAVRDRYGKSEFGQHAIVARRLVEAGVPMVKVTRAFWDSHHDNFESHRELCGDLDHVLAALLSDLEERGLLESTLVVLLSEFGRTPKINPNVGRDHYAAAWSFAMAGCGVQAGTVYGKTDEDGVEVADGKADAGDVLATIYQAAGIDPHSYYYVGVRPVPLAPEESEAIKGVLA